MKIIQPTSGPIADKVVVAPVYSVLVSLAMLADEVHLRQDEQWLAELDAQLSAEERSQNKRIFEGTAAPFLPENGLLPREVPFPSYLSALEALETAQVAQRFEPLAAAWGSAELAHQAISSHLREMWHRYFATQWERSMRTLHTVVPALNDREWANGSAAAAIRAFTQRPLQDTVAEMLSGVTQVVFAPSPFINHYPVKFQDPSCLWLFVDGDPRKLPMRVEPVRRSEILGTVNALADDTRLQILELLAAYAELRSQEIIERLDVTQSTVSRHLNQLRKAGFVTESRQGDASKVYRLVKDRIAALNYVLTQLLSAENANLILNDKRTGLPSELRQFLNRDGQLVTWPTKKSPETAVMVYLMGHFDPEKSYLEREINDLLNQVHIFKDPAYIRRRLVGSGYLGREKDGSLYWVIRQV